METSGIGLPLSKGLALIGLIGLYFFGVWLRTYVLPADTTLPFKRQLAAAIPVGLITMGAYGKAALPPLFTATSDVSGDIAIMIGYTIVFGMMSREALEKLLKSPIPGLNRGGGGGNAGGNNVAGGAS
jgi:hypothetical protein